MYTVFDVGLCEGKRMDEKDLLKVVEEGDYELVESILDKGVFSVNGDDCVSVYVQCVMFMLVLTIVWNDSFDGCF